VIATSYNPPLAFTVELRKVIARGQVLRVFRLSVVDRPVGYLSCESQWTMETLSFGRLMNVGIAATLSPLEHVMTSFAATTPLGEDRFQLNEGLHGSRNRTMLSLLGNPRGTYDQECRWPTNRALLDIIVQRNVGPFKVSGLRPAVDTLEQILQDVRSSQPEIYKVLGHQGMLCCRYVRGSTSAISNHSWGTAIDITLEGQLDKRGDNRAQVGLLAIYKIFNAHKFFWGAAFPTEDAMHFEASEELIREWHELGVFGDGKLPNSNIAFEFGDRGQDVKLLQEGLNHLLASDVNTDGIFGPATRSAVIELQRQMNLELSGSVDHSMWKEIQARIANPLAITA
jgi:hypothetical protein